MARKHLVVSVPLEGTDINPEANVGTEAAETNGTAPATAVKTRKAKSTRSTFYLIIGTSLDGRAIDVLGRYPTRHQAMRNLEGMGYVTTRNYKEVAVLQCRDKTAA